MQFSEEQQQALNDFINNKNIFLTGPGGSGKTELIKYMVNIAQNKNKSIQVCALTGCAAILLGCKAKTIHSWAGIGLASGESFDIVNKVLNNKYKKARWKTIDILIIDEVSMMSEKLFDILDLIAKRAKKCFDKPFGGIQLVFSGDFYQLPPVGDDHDQITKNFCFESSNWKKTFNSTIKLTKIFRQNDLDYTKILNQIRVGKLTKSSYNKLLERVNLVRDNNENKILPTILLPKKYGVDLINKTELSKLTGEDYIFNTTRVDISELSLTNDEIVEFDIASSQFKENEYNNLTENIMADKNLLLKVGAQVMCIANIDMESSHPIVNGSQGIITEFKNGLPLVEFKDGQKKIIGYHNWSSENIKGVAIKQIPLIHAWAITIHKAQGVTLEFAEIDSGSNIFEAGQTYVALSRVKSLSGLYLTAFNPQKIKVNRKVIEFYNSI